jgi:hypothetical protein
MKMIEGSSKWVTVMCMYQEKKKQEDKHQSGVKKKCIEKLL